MWRAQVKGSGTENVPSKGAEVLPYYSQVTEDVSKSCNFETNVMAFGE
jgi:hypothetical protein